MDTFPKFIIENNAPEGDADSNGGRLMLALAVYEHVPWPHLPRVCQEQAFRHRWQQGRDLPICHLLQTLIALPLSVQHNCIHVLYRFAMRKLVVFCGPYVFVIYIFH